MTEKKTLKFGSEDRLEFERLHLEWAMRRGDKSLSSGMSVTAGPDLDGKISVSLNVAPDFLAYLRENNFRFTLVP